MHESAKAKLLIAQQRQTKAASKHRRPTEIKEGDRVSLSLKFIRTLGSGAPPKLGPLFAGPFKVLKMITPNTCRLQLPPGFRVRNVANVNRLKLFVDGSISHPSRVIQNSQPTSVDQDDLGEPQYEVELVIARRYTGDATQYKVKWRGYEEHHNSWEPAVNLEGADEAIAKFLAD